MSNNKDKILTFLRERYGGKALVFYPGKPYVHYATIMGFQIRGAYVDVLLRFEVYNMDPFVEYTRLREEVRQYYGINFGAVIEKTNKCQIAIP